MDDIAAQMKIYIGLAGAALAAMIGSLARHVYAVDGFSWRRAAWDIPFAIVSALIVGGAGELFQVAPVVVYGGAGAFGYLGPQWLGDFLKKRAEERAALKGRSDDASKDA